MKLINYYKIKSEVIAMSTKMPTNDNLKAFFKYALQDEKFQQDMKMLKSNFIQYHNHIDKTLNRIYTHLNVQAYDLKGEVEYNHIKKFIEDMSRKHILYAFGGQTDYTLLTWIDTSFQWVVQVDIQPIYHLKTINIKDVFNNDNKERIYVADIHRCHAFKEATHQQVKNDIIEVMDKNHVTHFNTK